MRIYKAKDYVDMSRKAANIVSAQVIMNQIVFWGLQPDLLRSVFISSWWNGITKVILISQKL